MPNVVPNAVVLMFVRGWQGGTLNQIANELDVQPNEIQSASYKTMGALMRRAQRKRNEAVADFRMERGEHEVVQYVPGPRAVGGKSAFIPVTSFEHNDLHLSPEEYRAYGERLHDQVNAMRERMGLESLSGKMLPTAPPAIVTSFDWPFSEPKEGLGPAEGLRSGLEKPSVVVRGTREVRPNCQCFACRSATPDAMGSR